MKLENRLLKIMKEYREKFEKEQLEKAQKEAKKIVEDLNLQNILNSQKQNELALMFEDSRKKAEILKETSEKISQGFKNTNSVFNYMDNGKLDNNAKSQFSLKPILLKLFDDNKDDEINKEVDDKFGKDSSVFDILNKSFKGKLMFDNKGNLLLDDNKKAEKVEAENSESKEDEKVKEVEVESSSNDDENKEDKKEKNKNIQRLRCR